LSPVLAVWTLPFLWIGITLTVRRAVSAGRSPWWSFLFFVPYANYLLILVLAILPPVPVLAKPDTQGWVGPGGPLLAVAGGLALALAMVAYSVVTLGRYGPALFFGTPFAVGALTAFLFNRRNEVSLAETMGVVALTIVLGGCALFLLGQEGAVCLALALPLALPVSFMGALLGREIARSATPLRPAGLAMLALPLSATLHTTPPHPILHEVRSAVEINAPPARVWETVIAFPPIDAPLDLPSRLGVAYPEYAHIDGSGVGATRYCVFSTGPFVEPITRWEPGSRLSFDVSHAPPPLRELSPYPGLAPRHLDGYLLPKRGEFRLIALPNGRTRLEGSTWYEIRIEPETYWAPITDALIARIHRRVLDHIRAVAEHAPAA
jgi:hypothetical protein